MDSVEEFALPGTAYQMEWYIGKVLYYRDITSSNATGWFNDPQYGIIEEIKEGVFGGKRPLKYVDMNGVRIIHGIGVTEWKDGECLFGQICPYKYSFFNNGKLPEERHYRSMLVHFERGGEVLYDVWPEKGAINDMDNTGIDLPTCSLADDSRLFDLQGRQATGTPRKGIYIKNGRKRVYR